MERFKNILCVLAPGETSQHALERAVTLAENNQASLTVVDVIPHIVAGIGMPARSLSQANRHAGKSAAGYAIPGNYPRGIAQRA